MTDFLLAKGNPPKHPERWRYDPDAFDGFGGLVYVPVERTHCTEGHELTEDNTIWQKTGLDKFWAACRLCKNTKARAKRAEKREQKEG